jgi:hypothetical protein
MLPPILKLKEDLKGTNPENKVIDEEHKIDTSGSRIIVPNYGCFYVESVRIFRKTDGSEVPKEQIKAHYMDEELTLRTGKVVGQLLELKNTDNESDYYLHAQMVGGKHASYDSLIIKMIQEQQLDTRLVEWAKIKNKPTKFQPKKHTHHINQTYGYQRLIYVLDRLRKAILINDRLEHEKILSYFDKETLRVYEDIKAAKEQAKQYTDQHAADNDNPHGTQAVHVNLGLAPNFPPATIQETIAGVADDKLVVPIGVLQAIRHQVIPLITEHAALRNNPHGTTKHQVDLGNVFNGRMATAEETVLGLSEITYVHPKGVREHIQKKAIDPLNQHKARTDNPHGTTKYEVELGNVINAPIATEQQAIEGSTHLAYMTPYLAHKAIQYLFTDPITNHKANKNNPHGTTKHHIGLGKVPNMSLEELKAYFASVEHAHDYDDLPFSYSDVNRWNQAAGDLATLGNFDDQGDYPLLRARGTLKKDVGLEKAPNWGPQEFDARYASKGHTHSEYITRSEADQKYAQKSDSGQIVSYLEAYTDYAIKKHVLNETATKPTRPSI